MTTAMIRYSEFLPHPVARVWKVLTRPEMMEKWWVRGDVRPEAGHRFTLDMGKWGIQPCEILAAEPERVLSYSFAGTMTLTWRLEPKGEGTLLTFEHDGFDLDSPLGRTAFEGMGNGWVRVLKRIGEVAAGELETVGGSCED